MNKTKLHMIGWPALALAVVLLSGCQNGGESSAEVRAEVARIRAEPGAPMPPLPMVAPPRPFPYNAALSDPFALPKALAPKAAGVSSPDPHRPRQPLEFFSLKELHMVGSLQGPNGTLMALVQTPDQIVHRVRMGMYLGKHEGKVVSISPERIVMEEIGPDGNGGWVTHKAELSMPAPVPLTAHGF